MIKKSNIVFNFDNSKEEGIKITNEIFPNHFLCLLCGKPGSGKTSLLKFVLKSSDLLFKVKEFFLNRNLIMCLLYHHLLENILIYFYLKIIFLVN